MKKTTIRLTMLLFAVMLINVSWAQSNARRITDQKMIDQLTTDWKSRNENNQNASLLWYKRGDSYYGTYQQDADHYMSFYDKNGAYLQSYKKSDWNTVPTTLRSAFNASMYKDQSVTGFWESTDPRKKGYYLEVEDKTGNRSPLWVDEAGEFRPYYNSIPNN